MSVINDMLRDLETRKAPMGDGVVSAAQVQEMIGQESPERVRKRMIVGVILGIALLGLVIGWFLFGAASPVPNSDSMIDSATPPLAAVEIVEPASPTEENRASVVSAAQENNVKIDAMPALDDQDTPAPAPVQTKVSTVSSDAMPVKPTTKAPVEVEYRSLESRTDQPLLASKEHKPVELAKPALIENKARTTRPASVPDTDVSPVEPAPVVPLTKTVSAKALDSQSAEAAQALFDRGQDLQAYALLKAFIAQQDAALRSKTVLITYLMRDQRTLEAGNILATLDVSQDPAIRQLNARWLVSSGKPDLAIFNLESRLPELADYPDYYALLASYYQQFGQAEKAVEFYSLLVQQDSNIANWWAGLAVALDSVGQVNQARIAYEKADRLPGLKTELKAFVRTRHRQLNR